MSSKEEHLTPKELVVKKYKALIRVKNLENEGADGDEYSNSGSSQSVIDFDVSLRDLDCRYFFLDYFFLCENKLPYSPGYKIPKKSIKKNTTKMALEEDISQSTKG